MLLSNRRERSGCAIVMTATRYRSVSIQICSPSVSKYTAPRSAVL